MDNKHSGRLYNPNPITEITRALVCQMNDEGYKPPIIAEILDRNPNQVRRLLSRIKKSGKYKYYVDLKYTGTH